MQMMGLFQLSCEPIARKYDIVLNIDWEDGTILFLTTKNMSDVKVQMFLTEMTAVITNNPIFKEVDRL